MPSKEAPGRKPFAAWATAVGRSMTRPAVLSSVLSAALIVSLSSCTGGDTYRGVVTIDLNRTASQPITLTSVLSDSARTATISPDKNGVYTFATDTLPTDIYVATPDGDHRLPMLIVSGESVKFCGTVAEWDKMTTSDEPTRVMMAAERLRCRLRAESDSALTAAKITTPAGRGIVADSLTTLRSAARAEADELLSHLPDSSLAALPIIGLPGVYDDVADYKLMARRVCNMAARHPEMSVLRSKEASLRKVEKLIELRKALAVGNDAPQFLFTSEAGEEISEGDLMGRRYALALMPDSATTPTRAVEMAMQMAKEGAKVLAEADSRLALTDKNIIRGRFTRLDSRGSLQIFAPAMVVVDKEGTISSLWLDTFRRQQ